MSPRATFEHLATRFTAASPHLEIFPSGALMLHLTIHGQRYCAEYFPTEQQFGLSHADQVSPFFEGVDEVFATSDELTTRLATLARGALFSREK